MEQRKATRSGRAASPTPVDAVKASPSMLTQGAGNVNCNGAEHCKSAVTLEPWWQRLAAPASAASYVLTSLAMTSLTKYAASVWKFPGSSFLLLVECVATVVVMWVTAPRGRAYQPLNSSIVRHLPLVTLAKALNMYLSFIAMTRTSLPVYNVLKRLQPVYAMIQDYMIRGSLATGWEFMGVALICISTLITGSGDLDFDLQGYVIALVAAGCQSLYLVLARHAQDKVVGLTHVDLLFYTAFYNCILFFPLSWSEKSDIERFLSAPGEFQRLFIFLVPYVLLGALLNYTTFWCTAANSPLATAVAGNAKGVLSTFVGLVTFGGRLNAVGWIGMLGSTTGGFIYSAAQASRKRASPAKEAKSDDKQSQSKKEE